VVIPTGEENLELVGLLVTEGQRGCAIGLDELLILGGLPRERGLPAAKAGRPIQKPEAEALAALARLERAGLVEGIVRHDSADWHLSAAACRALGYSPSGELENQVVQFVERHGRITRKQAAGLCRFGPYRATRLLDRLVPGCIARPQDAGDAVRVEVHENFRGLTVERH
jgi:ATP-dependent DNA helicase RecG